MRNGATNGQQPSGGNPSVDMFARKRINGGASQLFALAAAMGPRARIVENGSAGDG